MRKGKTAIAGVLCFYFRDQVLPYYGGALAEYYKGLPEQFHVLESDGTKL